MANFNQSPRHSRLKQIGKLVFNSIVIFGVAIGFFTLIVTWKSYEANKTNIEYSYVFQAPLINVDKSEVSNLKLIYNNKEIEDAIYSAFEIKNIGNKAITKDEIINPISFEFKKEYNLLDDSVSLYTEPQNLFADFDIIVDKQGNKTLSLQTPLINKDNFIEVSYISSTFDYPEIKSAIKNVNSYKFTEKDSVDWFSFKVILSLVKIFMLRILTPLIIANFILSLILKVSVDYTDFTKEKIFSSFILSFGYAFMYPVIIILVTILLNDSSFSIYVD